MLPIIKHKVKLKIFRTMCRALALTSSENHWQKSNGHNGFDLLSCFTEISYSAFTQSVGITCS